MSAALKLDYSFRPMQERDLDAILQIEPTIYSHPWTRGHFSDSLKAGHHAYVMVLQDEIVGYALIMVVLDEAQLLNISIASASQQQGLGRELLTYLLDNAKARGAVSLFLEVRASNVTAIKLYEGVGFVEVSVRRGYYPAPEGREDAILMRLAL